MNSAGLQRACHTVLPGHRARTPAEMFALMSEWCARHGIEHDVYGSGEAIEAFERKVAKLLGFEQAVFCITGTMAQVTALRLACEDRGQDLVALHPTTHIIVLEDGKVVETGTHAELVALGGIYANLAALQFHSVHVTHQEAP